MLNGLAGKTAVLTGAGSGFGLECMRIAAKAGMKVALVDVQDDALARAADEARQLGAADVMACRLDVGNAEMVPSGMASPDVLRPVQTMAPSFT